MIGLAKYSLSMILFGKKRWSTNNLARKGWCVNFIRDFSDTAVMAVKLAWVRLHLARVWNKLTTQLKQNPAFL